jgi:hypothetical protein
MNVNLLEGVLRLQARRGDLRKGDGGSIINTARLGLVGWR